jgi:hypothetical protein
MDGSGSEAGDIISGQNALDRESHFIQNVQIYRRVARGLLWRKECVNAHPSAKVLEMASEDKTISPVLSFAGNNENAEA